MSIRSLLTCLALMSAAGQAQYVLEDDYFSDGNFFDMFSFFTSGDPTHGSVSYVSQATAQSGGLISKNNGQVYMGMDYTNVAPNGRNSVRITSNKSYNSGLVILDLAHMPVGCGTWPAFWMVGPDWPNNGEIDIIEGVNDQTTNDMTLHSSDGCSLSSSGTMTGTLSTSNCYVNAPGQYANQGCGISTGNTQTYGSGFNAVGGGVYATEWTNSAIKIYFFPRSSIPSDITNGKPNPASWGSPIALFNGCDFPSHFKNLQLVFDITTCGDWAGATWSSSSCASKASSCSAFVANNPSAFKDANWLINSLKVYQSNGVQSTAGNAPAAPAPVAPSSTAQPVAATSPVAAAPSPSSSSEPGNAAQTTGNGVPIGTSSTSNSGSSNSNANSDSSQHSAAQTTGFGVPIGTRDVAARTYNMARHLRAHLRRALSK